jgi:hypothetical protein
MTPTNIHEDILRHLWTGKYLDNERLTTIDGQPVRVITPGTLNRGGGPDFRDAVVVLDGKTLRGDVEFHRTIEDWKTHSHNVDTRYNSVILHVVLRGDSRGVPTLSASGRSIPVLIIDQFLSSPLGKILEHTMRDEYLSRSAPLRCFRHNDIVGVEVLEPWIRRLYAERMKEKEARMLARLHQIIDDYHRGVFEPTKKYNENPDDIPVSEMNIDKQELRLTGAWEQLLYGAIVDGLGYSKNRIPFRTLAHRVSIRRLRLLTSSRELTVPEIQAILFRASGLLPDIHSLNDQQSKVSVHLLHATWRDLVARRDSALLLAVEPLHAAAWTFTPTRPSNFPTARIAAAGYLLSKILNEQLFKHIIMVVAGGYISAQDKLDQLMSLFDIPEDLFWSYHYSFSEASTRRRSLLGDARKHDIIVNAILPMCKLHGRVFDNDRMDEHTARIAAIVPVLESNAVIRKMEKQLLNRKLTMHAAFQQQGAIHLYRRYCIMERCSDCDVGKVVFGK